MRVGQCVHLLQFRSRGLEERNHDIVEAIALQMNSRRRVDMLKGEYMSMQCTFVHVPILAVTCAIKGTSKIPDT